MKKIFQAFTGVILMLAILFPAPLSVSAETSVEVDGRIGYVTTYHIVYDANGGTGGGVGVDIAPGDTDTVLSCEDQGIAWSNHIFTGWNTQADGEGTAYAVGDSITLNSDVTLYAQWMKKAAVKPAGNNASSTIISGSPKTGDTNELPWLFSLCGISLIAIIILIDQRRKEHEQKS